MTSLLTAPRVHSDYRPQPALILPAELPRKWQVPTVADIAAIVTMTDPVQRNLHITQTYHALTIALTHLFGSRNVNWCAYATWASKTAGVFIRKEEVRAMTRSYLEASDHIHRTLAHVNDLLRWIGQNAYIGHTFIMDLLQHVTDEVARSITLGNLIVFEEIAPLYARLLELFGASDGYDQAALDRFLAALTPGPIEQGGQDYLIRAFTHYYTAMFERDPKARAELILLANLLVGYHEQTRLQEPILRAMDAPIEDMLEFGIFSGVIGVIHVTTDEFAHGPLFNILRKPLQTLAKRIATEWRTIMTRWLMRLEIADEHFDLGKDVPPLPSGLMFPPELMRLRNPELLALLRELDRTPDTSRGSAAHDWGSLADRMNYVVDFFRSRQQSACLYRQPFDDEQVAALRAGGMPAGRL